MKASPGFDPQINLIMKNYLLLCLLLVSGTSIFAQTSVPDNNTKPVKLSDLAAAYEKNENPPTAKKESKGRDDDKDIDEDGNYQFDRWFWYMSKHTDENGNVFSPAKTVNEWNKYTQNNRRPTAKTTGNASNWTFDGPVTSAGGYGGVGRVNVMAFHPSNANTYWAGSAGGGVWKTIDNGNNWTCLTDNLPALSVSDLDVNPLNANTMYLCTGDGDGRDYFSIGVLKTVNGGITWDTTGIKWDASSLRYTNSLVINRLDTNSLMVAASDGIYKSNDGGVSWHVVKTGYFKQVLYHPTDTNIVFATSFRTVANNTDAQIFRSANGGATWTQVSNFTTSWRITMAVTPANLKIVKAVVATYNPSNYRGLLGIYNSTDTGKNYSQIYTPSGGCVGNLLCGDLQGNTCGGQGNYDLAMAINPTNANEVYVGGVNTYASGNGGSNWVMITQWYNGSPSVAEVHADKHFLVFHPLVANRLFECNDGGLYQTDNPASTQWTDLSNGLGITQFYRNAVGPGTDVLGGAQDNGTKIDQAGVFSDLTGGDGMECQIDNLFPCLYVTGVQYGKFYASNDCGNSFYDISSNIPGQPTGAWITPLTIHPLASGVLVAGYKNVFLSTDAGQSWTSISPGFPRNLLRIAMTPADTNTIYALEDSSTIIHYTQNLGTSWTTITAPYGTNISDIKVDAKDKTHFWITLTGYGADKVAEYKQGNWSTMNTNLPNVPVECIEQDSSTGTLYIGTEVSVFYRDKTMTQWELFNNHLPAVMICDLGINYGSNEIWAATYGRGMWRSKKQTTGIENKPVAASVLNIFPNPNKGVFTITGFNKYVIGKTIEIKAIDMNVKTVWKNSYTPDNAAAIKVNLSGVLPGTYNITATTNNIKIASSNIVVE